MDIAGPAGRGGAGCKRLVARALRCCAAPLGTKTWRASDSRVTAIRFDAATPRACGRHVHARRVLRLCAHRAQTATGARCVTRRVLRSAAPARERVRRVWRDVESAQKRTSSVPQPPCRFAPDTRVCAAPPRARHSWLTRRGATSSSRPGRARGLATRRRRAPRAGSCCKRSPAVLCSER
jgi:hypothetical protein